MVEEFKDVIEWLDSFEGVEWYIRNFNQIMFAGGAFASIKPDHDCPNQEYCRNWCGTDEPYTLNYSEAKDVFLNPWCPRVKIIFEPEGIEGLSSPA